MGTAGEMEGLLRTLWSLESLIEDALEGSKEVVRSWELVDLFMDSLRCYESSVFEHLDAFAVHADSDTAKVVCRSIALRLRGSVAGYDDPRKVVLEPEVRTKLLRGVFESLEFVLRDIERVRTYVSALTETLSVLEELAKSVLSLKVEHPSPEPGPHE